MTQPGHRPTRGTPGEPSRENTPSRATGEPSPRADRAPSAGRAIEPVQVNMRAMFLVGTALWLVGGAVVGVLLATGAATQTGWLAICGVGAAIGLGGWRWAIWRRR